MREESRIQRLPVGDSTAIVILFMFIIVVISVPKYEPGEVIALASIPLLLATAGGVSLRPVMKRLLIASPFIVLMAAGNLFFDRSPLCLVSGIVITGGMVSASVIAMKSIVTLSTLLSFMEGMPFHRFGTALRGLGVPEVFVTQLLLVYRYSFLLSEEATMMQKARDLRSFGDRGRGPLITARLIGSLLIRTTTRAESIYRAMSARGFRTGLATSHPAPPKAGDIAVAVLAGALFMLVRYLF